MYDVRLPNIDWLGKRGDTDYMFETDPADQQGRILFYGDSAFTRWQRREGCWHELEEDILGKDGSQAALNHGFGTSTAEELLYYYPTLVRPWAPRALVVQAYCNDRDAGYSADEIIFLQARLLDWARHDFPGIRLYLCDKRPLGKERAAAGRSADAEFNELCRDYCRRHDDTALVCHADCAGLWEPGCAGDYDRPRMDLFIPDLIHYNKAGYQIYRDFFLKLLDDIL